MFRAIEIAILGACLMLFQGVAAGNDEPVLLEGVAAYVNDEPILLGEVMDILNPVAQQLRRVYSGDEYKGEMKKAYEDSLNLLIEQRLILNAYEEMERFQIPEWAIQQHIDEIIGDVFKGNREDLLAALAKDGMTYEEWRDRVERKVIVSAMRDYWVTRHVGVTMLEAKKVYEENPLKYAPPEKVQLSIIEMSAASATGETPLDRAARALARLRSGEEFAQVARDMSDGGKADQGGEWGWIEVEMLRPELADAARNLKAGEVSGVIEAGNEAYIMKLEDRENTGKPEFEEVQEQIETDLKLEKAKELYDDWIERLRSKAHVETYDLDLF